MKIFVTADAHFNHENIIKYCDRPFKNVNEMNEAIIKNWNDLVREDDVVYHLGDFGFGTKEELQDIFNRLNGKKYLIMGNHDYRVGRNYYMDLGFIEVYKKKCIIDNLVLTHRPYDVLDGYINLYGHIHNKPVDSKYDDDKHFCVCLDKHDFKLIDIEKEVKSLL